MAADKRQRSLDDAVRPLMGRGMSDSQSVKGDAQRAAQNVAEDDIAKCVAD